SGQGKSAVWRKGQTPDYVLFIRATNNFAGLNVPKRKDGIVVHRKHLPPVRGKGNQVGGGFELELAADLSDNPEVQTEDLDLMFFTQAHCGSLDKRFFGFDCRIGGG